MAENTIVKAVKYVLNNIRSVIISGIAGHINWIFYTIDLLLGADMHVQI